MADAPALAKVLRDDNDRTIVLRPDGVEEACYHDYEALWCRMVGGVLNLCCRICGRPKTTEEPA